MRLLTKEILKKLPKLRETDGKEKNHVVKFFTPDSNWTWYAVEGEQTEDGFIFFGLVEGFEKEWGYFTLEELESARGPMGLKIERNYSYTIEDFKKQHGGI